MTQQSFSTERLVKTPGIYRLDQDGARTYTFRDNDRFYKPSQSMNEALDNFRRQLHWDPDSVQTIKVVPASAFIPRIL